MWYRIASGSEKSDECAGMLAHSSLAVATSCSSPASRSSLPAKCV